MHAHKFGAVYLLSMLFVIVNDVRTDADGVPLHGLLYVLSGTCLVLFPAWPCRLQFVASLCLFVLCCHVLLTMSVDNVLVSLSVHGDA